ncbi:unnamed protein product [Meganyctiphanes norvegica]|uniref:Cyclin-dependent kinase inhibitor domain-containing protein n=1 Tax=Meganyctiphanes norvegica TaxID=48144 RepID=A0AAV2SCF1_MEGNR
MTMAVEAFPPIVHRVGSMVAPKSTSFRIKRATLGAGGARRALSDLGNNNAQFNLRMAQSQFANSQEMFAKKWNFDPVKEVPLMQVRYQWTPVACSFKKALSAPVEIVKDLSLSKDVTKCILPSLSTSATSRVPDLHQASIDRENDNTVQNSTIKQEIGANEVETNSENTNDSTIPNLHKANQDVPDSVSIVKHASSKQDSGSNKDKSESLSTKQGPSPKSDTLFVSTKIASSKSQKCITDFLRPQKRILSYHLDDCQASSRSPPKKKSRTLH